jgi:hypothetical protein
VTAAVDFEALKRFVGKYSVEGQTPAGGLYRGETDITRHGCFLHTAARLHDLAGSAPNVVPAWPWLRQVDKLMRYGLAMPFSGRLVMAFGVKDKVEIGAYQITGKNVVGTWVPPGAADVDFSNCGREESVIESPGVFKITQAYAVDKSAYTGAVRLTPADGTFLDRPPTPVKMTWTLHDGEYNSFAIAYPNAVYSTFNLAPGEPHGIAVYDIAGDTLNGVWLSDAGLILGSETLRPA